MSSNLKNLCGNSCKINKITVKQNRTRDFAKYFLFLAHFNLCTDFKGHRNITFEISQKVEV